jgi:hypothetical protein
MDINYKALLSRISRDKTNLENRKRFVDDVIQPAVNEFEADMVSTGYSPDEVLAAARVFREKLMTRELHQIEIQLAELDHFEKELRRVSDSLKTFSAEGLEIYLS